MSPQVALPGFEPLVAEDSLFFCVFPDAAACEAIAVECDALRVEHSLLGRSLEASRLHLTLHYLGQHAGVRQDIVDAACAAAERVTQPPFGITLAHASSLGGGQDRRPCVLLCPEERPPVHALWRELGTQLMAAGLGRYLQRTFTPHVTLLYDTHALVPQEIEPIRWQARDFALVHSVAGRGEYRVLRSWPLGTSAAATLAGA
jgi:RNA 2',3'-cyclic 3'-phosphodiesterase